MKKVKDSYTLDKTKAGEEEKTQISPESYAICEFLEDLTAKLEHARVSLNGR